MAPGIGDFLGRLFGGGGGREGAARREPPEDYKGYQVTAAPRQQGGQWVVAGTIARTEQGETREYHFIRADSHAAREGAVELTLIKARQIIDLEGDRIFDKTS